MASRTHTLNLQIPLVRLLHGLIYENLYCAMVWQEAGTYFQDQARGTLPIAGGGAPAAFDVVPMAALLMCVGLSGAAAEGIDFDFEIAFRTFLFKVRLARFRASWAALLALR